MIGDLLTHWFKFAQGRRTIVFCVDVKHSRHVCEEFVKAEHIDGTTPKAEHDAVVKRFEAGEVTVICNCAVFIEGLDVPPTGCIVLARPTKSLGLFRQMAGRGRRPWPGKTNLILIDHSGAVFRHGFLEDPIAWSLDVDKKVQNKIHDARGINDIRRELECSQCGALRQGGEACPNCGFLPKRASDAIIFADGNLVRVGSSGDGRPSPAQERAFYQELLFIAGTVATAKAGRITASRTSSSTIPGAIGNTSIRSSLSRRRLGAML